MQNNDLLGAFGYCADDNRPAQLLVGNERVGKRESGEYHSVSTFLDAIQELRLRSANYILSLQRCFPFLRPKSRVNLTKGPKCINSLANAVRELGSKEQR